MHFLPFPPIPPFPLLHFLLVPLLLTAALVFAVLRFARRRAFAFADGDGRTSRDHCLRRQSLRDRHDRSNSRQGGRPDNSGNSGNAAFDEYRSATLAKLESEAAEFRTFLDGLRRAADAADFEAFLKARREGGHQT